ncbi:hypothetical protein [Pseudooceanicola nitratireducens]|uniref:hypothetical protein n=1 Tax=Pseudooceanicola nitratireducens TaxID=517719 RepID=UPI001C95802C|nr:hypothetical protein [Pseudooceanicola nitratireducens]MBY6156301.1 hypothetical protein [Pseudooceanicola nitratireducens]
MTRNTWHMARDADTLTLARHLPARFDVVARADLSGDAGLSLGRLAHQVRQDVWRGLQRVRGFSPVVRVTRAAHGVTIEAGGRLAAPRAAGGAEAALSDILTNPANRARWMTQAAKSQAAKGHSARGRKGRAV